jgi:hypothetical protein
MGCCSEVSSQSSIDGFCELRLDLPRIESRLMLPMVSAQPLRERPDLECQRTVEPLTFGKLAS